MMIPLFLILLGVLYLLRNTGLLPDPAWDVVWPLILIVMGGALFFHHGSRTQRLECWPGCACNMQGGGRKKA